MVRARSIELSQIGRGIVRAKGSKGERASGAGPSNGARAATRAAARRYLYYPDGQVGWYPAAVLAGLRLLRHERFDVVYSSSHPLTAHLIARTLSRRGKLPWVAEFRDPWSDRLPADHPHRRRTMRLEAAIGREATQVIVPTPTLAEMWGERWGREIALVPNGHDLDGPVRQRPERATLTHVGTYYPGKQSFRALWGALQELARSGEAELPRVRFVGELPEEIRQEVGAAGLATVVEATGFIPHADAMRSMASSTVLFASGFAGSDPLSLGVIPAKLFEYLATGLPILYLGNPEDDAAKLLREQPGCFVLEPDDVAGVVAALRVALAAGEYERDVASLSRRARTASLAKVLDAAAGRT